jgi:hypothetical protein
MMIALIEGNRIGTYCNGKEGHVDPCENNQKVEGKGCKICGCSNLPGGRLNTAESRKKSRLIVSFLCHEMFRAIKEHGGCFVTGSDACIKAILELHLVFTLETWNDGLLYFIHEKGDKKARKIAIKRFTKQGKVVLKNNWAFQSD